MMAPDNKAWHYEMMWWHGQQCYYYACLGKRVGLAMLSEYERHSKQMQHHSEMHRDQPAEHPLILTPQQIKDLMAVLRWLQSDLAVFAKARPSVVESWLDGSAIMPSPVANWLVEFAYYSRTHPPPRIDT